MRDSVIQHGELRLHYQEFGEGDDVLLAFHGVGGSGNEMLSMRVGLGKRFRVIAFDLFFHHPESSFPLARIERQPLSGAELCDMIRQFLHEQGIDRFSLLGYSLGAKVALALLNALPSRIDRVILMAPDGFHRNRLYDFARHRRIGRWLFRQTVRYPDIFLFPASVVHRLHLVPDRLYNFVVVKMSDRANREYLYNVWLTFRGIDTPLDESRRVVREHNVPLFLVLGKRDIVFPIHIGETFCQSLQPHAHLILVDRGHELLCAHVDSVLDEYLASCPNSAE